MKSPRNPPTREVHDLIPEEVGLPFFPVSKTEGETCLIQMVDAEYCFGHVEMAFGLPLPW